LAVSHELRTPVARVRFAVELLADAEQPADRAQQAEAIQQDLQELDELISELLTYASLEGGRQPQREALHLDHFLGARVEEAARIRASVAIDLVAFPLEIQADALLLKRALSNLLANAVRYGRNHIRVGMEQQGTTVQIWVEDDGPGIPVEDRERVFEPLVRLDQTRSRDTGGVGLGLALARRIARAHGGELVAEQGSLGGARLRMTLPL
jgi:signal transduction histidine kinase